MQRGQGNSWSSSRTFFFYVKFWQRIIKRCFSSFQGTRKTQVPQKTDPFQHTQPKPLKTDLFLFSSWVITHQVFQFLFPNINKKFVTQVDQRPPPKTRYLFFILFLLVNLCFFTFLVLILVRFCLMTTKPPDRQAVQMDACPTTTSFFLGGTTLNLLVWFRLDTRQYQKLKRSVIFSFFLSSFCLVFLLLSLFFSVSLIFDLFPVDVGLIRLLGQGQNSTCTGVLLGIPASSVWILTRGTPFFINFMKTLSLFSIFLIYFPNLK